MKRLDKALEAAKKLTSFSCVNYLHLMEDGETIGNNRTNCYGSISQNIRFIEDRKVVATVSKVQVDDTENMWSTLPEGTHQLFLSWLINDSVYKDVFITKDVDKIIKDQVFATRCDIPGNVMVSALTCFRALTEGDRGCHSGKHFKGLVDYGCKPEFAMVLGHYIHEDNLKPYYDTNHCILDCNNVSIDWVVNFCKKQITSPLKNNFQDDHRYFGLFELFDNNKNNGKFWTWLGEALLEVAQQKVEILRSVEPFCDVESISYKLGEDKYEILAKVCDKFYKEYIK